MIPAGEQPGADSGQDQAAACALCRLGDGAMRALLKTAFAPPLFRRPHSNRWIGYEGEIVDWLESNRKPPS
jgi:hypothetical protein